MKKIIAIDGPASAGKSTVSKIIAKRLGYIHIDTGAMYRAIVLKILKEDKNSEKDILRILNNFEIKFDDASRVFLDGYEITEEIRAPKISRLASDISSIGFVREKLTKLQREMARDGNVIMDGRDIGTQVLPNADLKIFLTASITERAWRRYRELKVKGFTEELSQIEREIVSRDKGDSERKIAPLKKAEDAILLDSSNLTIEKVVEKIQRLIEEN